MIIDEILPEVGKKYNLTKDPAGHGFGSRDGNQGAVAAWPMRFEEWMIDQKLLTR